MKEVLDSKGRETYIEHSDGFWSKTHTIYHTNGKVKRYELNTSEGKETVYRNSQGRIDEMVYDSKGTLVDTKNDIWVVKL